MQRASGGIINQFGIWTEQSLWRVTDAAAEKYAIDIVDDLQLIGNGMANEDHAPAVFILNANTAKVKTATLSLIHNTEPTSLQSSSDAGE